MGESTARNSVPTRSRFSRTNNMGGTFREAPGQKAEDAKTTSKQKVKREAPGLKAKHVGSSASRRGKKANVGASSRSMEQGTRSLLTMDVAQGYQPPSSDSIDDIIQKVDHGEEDKYHLFESEEADSMDDFHLNRQTQNTSRFSTIKPPAVRHYTSETVSPSYEGTEASNYSELQPPSQTRASRRDVGSVTSVDSERFLCEEEAIWSDENFVVVKQRIAYLCIALSALQLVRQSCSPSLSSYHGLVT